MNGLIHGLGGVVRPAERKFASGLKLEERTLEALQKRVMQLTGNPRPFVDSGIDGRIELTSQLSRAQLKKKPKEEEESADAECIKPVCLKPRGGDAETKRCALLIPDTIAIAGDNAEMVFAGTEPCVESIPASARILPILIHALQHVPELKLLWKRKVQRGIADLNVGGARGKTQIFERKNRRATRTE
jgi:hypothetical protein